MTDDATTKHPCPRCEGTGIYTLYYEVDGVEGEQTSRCNACGGEGKLTREEWHAFLAFLESLQTEGTDPMNELAKTPRNNMVPTERNAFEEFGASGLVGRFLRFVKGDFLTGDAENPEVIELGTRFVAEVQNMERGWVKWRGKTPVDQRMNLVSERIMPARDELGDRDEALWEDNNDGSKRDPWQQTYKLTLRSVDDPDDDDAAFVFTTSSKGGARAMKKLCKIFGKEGLRQRPGQLPIIELGFTKYDHSDWGPMKNPAFPVVGWTALDADNGNGAGNGKAADDEEAPF